MKTIKYYVMLVLFTGLFFYSAEVYANTTAENYVRITQPTSKDVIQTFDSEMNIMGEASVGTEINIVVYYGEEVEVLTDVLEKDEYKLKTVGATKTFNQLITLKEGQNNIVIEYQYGGKGAKGTLKITIVRKAEAEKEAIKGYINPQAIVDKIVIPSQEKTGTTSPAMK